VRVLLANTVALNGGDAAMMIAAHHLLRRRFGADTEIVVQDDRAAAAARYFPSLRFRAPLLDRSRRGLRARGDRARLWAAMRGVSALARSEEQATLRDWERFDLVASTGGTYLVDHYDLRPRGFELTALARLGVPLIFLPQTLGPIRKPAHRRALAPAMTSARAVFLRDDRSRDAAIALGAAPRRCRVTPDLAFALADAERLERAAARQIPAEGPHVGISVRHWRRFADGEAGRERFEASMAALAAHVVTEHRGRVTFTSTCQGIPEYWADDAAVARRVVAQVPEAARDRVHVEAEFAAPEARIARLAHLDLYVSTRLHGAIMALLAGTPVLPIEYERKTKDVFHGLGRADWVGSVDDASPDALRARFDRWVAQVPAARADLFARVAALGATARSILDDFELGGGPRVAS